jgi:hypothetical protein
VKTKRPRHPGRNANEKRILDLIGSGFGRPPAKEATLDRMVDAGLLEKRGTNYEMTVPTHIQWCEYWASVATVELK